MKILSIDGGGIRGLIPAIILSEIERMAGKPISELFDLIAGTSTGGLITLGLTVPDRKGKAKFSASDLVKVYEERGKEVFDRSVWHRLRSLGGALEEKYPNDGLIRIVDEMMGMLC